MLARQEERQRDQERRAGRARRAHLHYLFGQLRAVYHGPLLMLTYYALSYKPQNSMARPRD